MKDTERANANLVGQHIRSARLAQRLTFRKFAAELGVAHNAVAQWENGTAEPTPDRIKAWLEDRRDWVRQLGLQVFAIKFGPMMASVAAGAEQPPAAG